jgi:hypothetical protein
MLNTKQRRLLFIAVVLLYVGKIIYRYVQNKEVDYFDVGLGLFWLGLLLFTDKEQNSNKP